MLQLDHWFGGTSVDYQVIITPGDMQGKEFLGMFRALNPYRQLTAMSASLALADKGARRWPLTFSTMNALSEMFNAFKFL